MNVLAQELIGTKEQSHKELIPAKYVDLDCLQWLRWRT